MLHSGNFEFVVPPRRPIQRHPNPSTTRRPSFQYSHQPVRAARQIPRRKKSHWTLSVFGMFVLLLLGAVGASAFMRPTTQSKGVVNAVSTQSQKVAAVPVIPAPTIDEARLNSELNALIAANPQLDISISYRDITTGQSFHYGVTAHYVAASVSKLMTAVLYLREVDNGTYALSDKVGAGTAQNQLQLLIEKSDNQAWADFNSLLGTAKFKAFAAEIGLQDYDHAQNITLSEDVALLLTKLYKGELLSQKSTDLLLSHMEAADNRQYIVGAIPPGVTVYHKAGYLKDRAHDAAIIDNGRHPYVLVIFTKARNSNYDFAEGPTLLQTITKTIDQTYQTN